MDKLPISVVILTLNEEKNVEECLKSLYGWVDEIFIVDSYSTDQTLEIARKYTDKILQHPFDTHTRQWNWALENLSLQNEWILGLDTDQRITPELRSELQDLFVVENSRLEEIDGLYMKRRQIFRGKWIRHGGYYPKYLLKLFRRGKVRTGLTDLVDHHFYVQGRTGKLQNDLIEDNRKENDISFWIEKHNRYATLLAAEEVWQKNGKRSEYISASPVGNPDQKVLWLKNIWSRLPLHVRPLLYFIYRYFFRFGFLDGKEGFIFHFLQAFWFRLLVDIKIEELRRKCVR